MAIQTTQGAGTGSAARFLIKNLSGFMRSPERPTRAAGAGVTTMRQMKIFQSDVIIGNGNFQNINHSLEQIPVAVIVTIVDTRPLVMAAGAEQDQDVLSNLNLIGGGVVTGIDNNFRILEGEHTDTNLIINVSNRIRYRVFAFA
jgi:hypothetical protein